MPNWIAPDYKYTVIQKKGTSAGALNKLEYLCEAEPGSSSSTAVWRITKFIYDSDGFNTDIKWADSDRKFDNIADNAATLTYG